MEIGERIIYVGDVSCQNRTNGKYNCVWFGVIGCKCFEAYCVTKHVKILICRIFRFLLELFHQKKRKVLNFNFQRNFLEFKVCSILIFRFLVLVHTNSCKLLPSILPAPRK